MEFYHFGIGTENCKKCCENVIATGATGASGARGAASHARLKSSREILIGFPCVSVSARLGQR